MSLFISERNTPWFIPTNPSESNHIEVIDLAEKKVVELKRGKFNFVPGELVFVYTPGEVQRITHKLFIRHVYDEVVTMDIIERFNEITSSLLSYSKLKENGLTCVKTRQRLKGYPLDYVKKIVG